MMSLLSPLQLTCIFSVCACVYVCRYLYQNKTGACGTIKANRLVKTVTDLEVTTKGEVKSLLCDELLAVKWYSSKIVYLLSTIHDDTMKTVRRRRRAPVRKPACVVDYNSKMGAVDKQDSMLEPYDATRKTARWYKKVIIHLLQVSLLNAFLLHKKDGHTKDFLSFQGDVVFSLLATGLAVPQQALQGRVQDEDFVRLSGRHFPSRVPDNENQERRTVKRCRVCSSQRVRRVSTCCCLTCPSQPGLCAVPCFMMYHTKLRYWED